MRKALGASVALVTMLALVAAAAGGGTTAVSAGAGAPGKDGAGAGHSKPLPKFVEKAQNDRIAAADAVARGAAKADANGIVTLKNGKKVRYKLQGEEYLTAALVDFTDVHHGQLPVPDRTVDNSTYYTADTTPQHYWDMLFAPGGASYGTPSMRDFYIQQSSGRFTWTGQVSNWVQIDTTESAFGANSRQSGAGGDDANGPVYRVVDATLKALAASGNYGGIDLAKADQVDRYDCDGDGVYNEPDGYIDHFAIVHAGMGEDAGGGAQGGDAIWSHRWYANFNQTDGPATCKLGGYNLPGTNLWAGDYTIEAENGGVGVFAHEFGHDLGLPDLYDTQSSVDNGTGFWTLMSSGSWASDSKYSIGDEPVHMGAWEKLALGWIDTDLGVTTAGQDATFDLGPAESATRGRYQALRINLPNIEKTQTAFPVDGSDANYFYSNKGNDLDNTLSKALPAATTGSTPLTFRAIWDTELNYDYAYVRALVGGLWQNIVIPGVTDANGAITGASNGWVTVNATLPAGTTAIGFCYWTDGGVANPGFAVDSISVGGGAVDNATSTAGWTLNGFIQTVNGQFTQSYFRYYLVESRSYIDNDKSLCGAYNFIYGDWLEKQCYADGLLITYRNSSVPDNDVSSHPGEGQILPIDSHPAPGIKPDGRNVLRERWQTWDSTFGVASHSVTLSQMLNSGKIVKQTYTAAPVSSFVDSSTTAYYDASLPANSVKTAGSGVQVDIVGVSADKTSYRVHVH